MTKYKVLCKVAETGSFTRAAEILGYSQANISQTIRSLEEEYGLVLVTRQHGGVTLTRAGEEVYSIARRIVEYDHILNEKVSEMNSAEYGEIHIGTFNSISQNLLPYLIKRFSEKYPDVRIYLRSGDNSDMGQRINNGIIDFGFIYPGVCNDLEYEPVVTDEFLAVLPEEHALAGRGFLTLAELAGEPLIALDEGNINSAGAAFEAAGITPNIRYLIQDDYTILAMIEQDLGIGVLPAAILRHTDFRFNAIPLRPSITREIGIAYKSEDYLPAAALRFIRFMREHISECTMGNFTPVINKH